MFASYEQTHRTPHPPGPHEAAYVLLNAESRVSHILLSGEPMPEAPGARRIPMPKAPDASDFVAAKLQGRMSDAQPTASRVHIASPDLRSLADHYRRNGESAEQAADRLADAAARFQLNRHGAAVSGEDANGVRYLSWGG